MAMSTFTWVAQVLLILSLCGCGSGAAAGSAGNAQTGDIAAPSAGSANAETDPETAEAVAKMAIGAVTATAAVTMPPETDDTGGFTPAIAKADEPLWPTLNPSTAFEPVKSQLPTARGPIVDAVVPQSLAEAMQIKPGDRLIGVNGRRIYSKREFDFVRLTTSPLFMPAGYRPGRWAMATKTGTSSNTFMTEFVTHALLSGVFGNGLQKQSDVDADELLLTFVQNGQVISILVSNLNPVRQCGFTLRDEADALALFRRIGLNPGRNDAKLLATFPLRIVIEASEWLDEDPARASQAQWLKELAATYLLLCRSQYDRVQEMKNEPPVPHAKRLATFYQSVARQNHEHGFDPDLKAYGEDAEYCALFYPLPEPARASEKTPLYVYLSARLRPTLFSSRKGYLHAREQLLAHPEWLLAGLQRTTTVWDEQMDLDDLSGDALDRRRELFGRLGDLAQFRFTDDDAERLAKLIRDGKGTLDYFDCLLRLTYWANEQEDAPWLVPVLTQLMTVEEAKHWDTTLQSLQTLDETIKAQQEPEAPLRLYGDQFDGLKLMGMIRAADHAAEAGQKNDAQMLCDDILLLYKRILSHPAVSARPWPYWHALSVLSNSPLTAKQAVAYGLKYLELEAPGRQVDSAFLFMAQAYLLEDDLQNAARMLSRSFSAQRDELVAYFAGDTLFNNAPAMRLAILHVMKQQPDWSPELAAQLLTNPSVRVEPKFLEMLERPSEPETAPETTPEPNSQAVPQDKPETPDATAPEDTASTPVSDADAAATAPSSTAEEGHEAVQTDADLLVPTSVDHVSKIVEPVVPAEAVTPAPDEPRPEQPDPAATPMVEPTNTTTPATPVKTEGPAKNAVIDVLDALPLPEPPAAESDDHKPAATPDAGSLTSAPSAASNESIESAKPTDAQPESAPVSDDELPLPNLKDLPELVPLPAPPAPEGEAETENTETKTATPESVSVPGETEPMQE